MKLQKEGGFVGGAEALVFGVLIFVIGTLIFVNGWSVIHYKFAVANAARDAARSYAEANNPSTAWQSAISAADDSFRASHGDSSKLHVAVDTPDYARCTSFEITVSYPVPIAFVPTMFSGSRQITVAAHYKDTVDPFRSGLPGNANC